LDFGFCGAEDRARSFLLPPIHRLCPKWIHFRVQPLTALTKLLYVGIHCSYVEGPSSCCRRHCPQQHRRADDKVETSHAHAANLVRQLVVLRRGGLGKDGGSNRVSAGAQTSIIYCLSSVVIGCGGSEGIPLDVSAPMPTVHTKASH